MTRNHNTMYAIHKEDNGGSKTFNELMITVTFLRLGGPLDKDIVRLHDGLHIMCGFID